MADRPDAGPRRDASNRQLVVAWPVTRPRWSLWVPGQSDFDIAYPPLTSTQTRCRDAHQRCVPRWYRPRPRPAEAPRGLLPRANGSKSVGRRAGSIGGPWFSTVMRTTAGSPVRTMCMGFVTSPCVTALPTRLDTTCSKRSASTRAKQLPFTCTLIVVDRYERALVCDLGGTRGSRSVASIPERKGNTAGHAGPRQIEELLDHPMHANAARRHALQVLAYVRRVSPAWSARGMSPEPC